MRFLRRGYVPRSIPIEKTVPLLSLVTQLSLLTWRISCFEEFERETGGERFCRVFSISGNVFDAGMGFDEFAGLLATLVVDDGGDVEPSDIGVEVLYPITADGKAVGDE